MSDKTVEKPSRPGKNGGKLNAGPGPGRPAGSVSIVKELKKVLAEGDNAEKVARAIVLHAAKGNGAAIRHLLERVDGKLPDEVLLTEDRHDLSKLSDEELRQWRLLASKARGDS